MDFEALKKEVEEGFDSFDLFKPKRIITKRPFRKKILTSKERRRKESETKEISEEKDLLEANWWIENPEESFREIGADYLIKSVDRGKFGIALQTLKRIRITNFDKQMKLLEFTSLKNQKQLFKYYYQKKGGQPPKNFKDLEIFSQTFLAVIEVINARREQNFLDKLKEDFEQKKFSPVFALLFYKTYLAGQVFIERRIKGLLELTEKTLAEETEHRQIAFNPINCKIKVDLEVLDIYRNATNYFALHSIKYFEELEKNLGELEEKLEGKKKNLFKLFGDGENAKYLSGKYTISEFSGRKKNKPLKEYGELVPKNWKTIASFLKELHDKKIIVFSYYSSKEDPAENYKESFVWQIHPLLYRLFGSIQGTEKGMKEKEFDLTLSNYLTYKKLTVSRLLNSLLYKEGIVKSKEMKLKRDFVFLLLNFFIKRVFWRTNRDSSIIKFENENNCQITV